MVTLRYGEKEPWLHNHNLCYRGQTLCNGKTSPLLFRKYCFFLLKEQASCKVTSFLSAGTQCLFTVFRRQMGDLPAMPHASWTLAIPKLETL